MENASKALIIAGSILLAILIIGVGIYIFNSANIDIEPQMSQMEINIFNQEYLMYEGIQSGKKVKEVLIKAAMYNESLDSTDYTNVLAKYGFGIRGTAKDIWDQVKDKPNDGDWKNQLAGTNKERWPKGIAQAANIRLIASWIRPNKRYDVSFNFFENGRIEEIIINDVKR